MPLRSAAITALLAAAALALAGCSGSPDAAPAASEPAPAGSSPAEPSASEPAASEPAGGDAEGTALTGMVGTADDPDAYEIALLGASGAAVTELPAGDYQLTFDDRSSVHNFRLRGPGDVDVSTEIVGTDDSTVSVTLAPGTYTIICDPHPSSMVAEIVVTG